MKLEQGIWLSFATYLFTDVKLSCDGNNESAYKSRFNILCQFFKDKDFTRENFNAFIWMKKKEGCKPEYLNGFIKLAKHFDRFSKAYILEDYTYFKKEAKVYTILTPDEIKAIADVTVAYARNREEKNQKYRALIYLMGMTGCRIDEALSLLWEDIHEDPHCVIFRRTKNSDDRAHPIGKFLYGLLIALPHI